MTTEQARSLIEAEGWTIALEPEPGRRSYMARRVVAGTLQCEHAATLEILLHRVSNRSTPEASTPPRRTRTNFARQTQATNSLAHAAANGNSNSSAGETR